MSRSGEHWQGQCGRVHVPFKDQRCDPVLHSRPSCWRMAGVIRAQESSAIRPSLQKAVSKRVRTVRAFQGGFIQELLEVVHHLYGGYVANQLQHSSNAV